MKYILLSIFLIINTFAVWGQRQLSPNPKAPIKIETSNKDAIRGISPTTAFLILDLKKDDDRKLSEEQLIEKYALIKKDGIIYANSFITIESDYEINNLKNYGVLTNTQNKNILTALIPIDKLELLSTNTKVLYIQIGEKVKQTMDNARGATNVDQVHVGNSLPQSYYGEGVVVGIIDGGFDYTHPNFFNSTGTSGYRVKRVWEQMATSGSSPTGFNYGRELASPNTITGAQRDMPHESHGTHVAGIAAGAGGGASTTYTGVAPKADLVFVSTNMTDPGIIDGIEYIQNYANSLGKPSVINMSLGGHVGPHDGTSTFDQLCDSFYVGEGKILVGSAGNEGNDELYLEKTYTTIDTSLFTFVYFENGPSFNDGDGIIDIWGNVGEEFYVAVHIYNYDTDEFEDSTPYLYNAAYTGSYTASLYDDDFWFPDECYVIIETGIDPNNNKPRALVYIDNSDQDDYYRMVLIEIRAASTQTKMWGNDVIFSDLGMYLPPVLSGNTNSTVGEIGGTGNSMISVGAYTSKNSWNSYSSGMQTADYYTTHGAIAPFSSKGPTADGRTKPDITAPGNVIISSVSNYDSYYSSSSPYTAYGINNGTTSWWFGAMQGTSMSAPMVTGIIALWLEMYPYLTPDQIKTIMQNTAITDSHTGVIPSSGNNTWGWGKINAWIDLPDNVPSKPIITPNITKLCEGESTTLNASSGYAEYQWNTGATTQSINVNTTGNYRVRVTNSAGFKSPWSDTRLITVSSNPPVPTITRNNDILTSSATSGNQWYRNGTIITGATGQQYALTSTGNYKVVVTNNNGCKSESATMNVQTTNISDLEEEKGISIYPNPTKEQINLRFDHHFSDLSYIIYDNSGKSILSGNFKSIYNNDVKTIHLGGLPHGIYYINLFNEEINHKTKITIID